MHHCTAMYIITTGNTSTSTSPYSALRHTSASTSPYCTLRHCPRSHFFLNYITILLFMSLFWVTLFLQVHHHRGHYVTVLGHTFSTSTSPYCTLRHCPGSHSFYRYITVFNITALGQAFSWVPITILHTASHSFHKYFNILHSTSLPCVTLLLLQVHHHTLLYAIALGHIFSSITLQYCTLCHCSGSHFFYKYIATEHTTSLSWDTLFSTSTWPYWSLRHCPVSHFFYKYITILRITSLPWVTLLLQVHQHAALYFTTLNHIISASVSLWYNSCHCTLYTVCHSK